MSSPEQIEALEAEWREQGVADGEIGARLRRLAAESELQAEQEEETPAEEPAPAPVEEPSEQDFPLCPVCGGIGRIPKELTQSPGQRTCSVCHGLGEVMTGSLKQDAAVTLCVACNGNGWEYVPEVNQQPPQPADPWKARY